MDMIKYEVLVKAFGDVYISKGYSIKRKEALVVGQILSYGQVGLVMSKVDRVTYSADGNKVYVTTKSM